jgi:hypothetical protein
MVCSLSLIAKGQKAGQAGAEDPTSWGLSHNCNLSAGVTSGRIIEKPRNAGITRKEAGHGPDNGDQLHCKHYYQA